MIGKKFLNHTNLVLLKELEGEGFCQADRPSLALFKLGFFFAGASEVLSPSLNYLKSASRTIAKCKWIGSKPLYRASEKAT